ncbi:MAPK regulated corepressor interacting protein 2 isoform X1 [Panthera pardus]|uniref:MAPK regulated corepressor interacting protein 2 n=2 Tax=Felidae TaxID=9681 RepID=A0ABI7WL61_FELCA|nr:MAPK regulated corepressor interacting protein 2 isoform X1 [Panthera pardus]XP_023102258.1 MAPK regulated corepressor interacting protein 2 isoform X1 [Felis catus]XP_040315494.1 MAPK regulated corepressor interacting protein 2 isoform X2 [Puma yagouaroundi]XP_043417062.1 MAPK regulated corepressor interacting protein 2 isoform X2 [Prionailurus bengalensis]XP_045317526.1 MAPK regulated corepressor interacting protein 2 isoform X2 [Leopardus geoffroyi]XP_058566971.1 MAPK regulated corepress
MYTITKGPSKLVAQRRTGPSQQQVESRLGELLKCRQPAPPTPSPPRAQPPGPWPLSSGPLSQGGPPSGGGAPEPRKASRPAGPRVPGGVARAAQDSRLPPPAVAWQQVERQLGGGPAGESGPRPVQYVEKTPNPRLQNFVPIDLDEWWAQQFLARITNCS